MPSEKELAKEDEKREDAFENWGREMEIRRELNVFVPNVLWLKGAKEVVGASWV